jgi:hypothetical protein
MVASSELEVNNRRVSDTEAARRKLAEVLRSVDTPDVRPRHFFF